MKQDFLWFNKSIIAASKRWNWIFLLISKKKINFRNRVEDIDQLLIDCCPADCWPIVIVFVVIKTQIIQPNPNYRPKKGKLQLWTVWNYQVKWTG